MHVYLISFIIKQHNDNKYVIFRPFCEHFKNESVSFIIY
ncbi:GTP pyrophosphokinase [Bacillus sp. SN10]|nr:GTP pyrophosphokinase [Bacillus sp. SN10]PKJ57597.1 GTP pyrophosphokinase [Bacillus sp. SN10]